MDIWILGLATDGFCQWQNLHIAGVYYNGHNDLIYFKLKGHSCLCTIYWIRIRQYGKQCHCISENYFDNILYSF